MLVVCSRYRMELREQINCGGKLLLRTCDSIFKFGSNED